ncbi:MAG: hypothetical protein AAF602_24515 [Myxococcota bacterium]
MPLYEHLGFTVRGHEVMPFSGIETWAMSEPFARGIVPRPDRAPKSWPVAGRSPV